MGKTGTAGLYKMVRLFENDWPVSRIALTMGVTKQAVSMRLRAYYLRKRPRVTVDVEMTRVCIVCGVEETSIEKSIPLAEFSKLRIKPIRRTKRFVCPLCKDMNLHRCTSCGAVGHVDSGLFQRSLNKNTQRALCKDCNRESHYIWRKKNPGKNREICNKWRRKAVIKRTKKGLCILCKKPNPSKYKICEECRKKAQGFRSNRK